MCCELRSGPPLTGPLRSHFLLPAAPGFEGVGAIAEHSRSRYVEVSCGSVLWVVGLRRPLGDVIAGVRRVASGESGYGLKVAGERR